jgi:hypothetical protein
MFKLPGPYIFALSKNTFLYILNMNQKRYMAMSRLFNMSGPHCLILENNAFIYILSIDSVEVLDRSRLSKMCGPRRTDYQKTHLSIY